ncbi:MAG: hypothetical protein K2N13_05665, partial [Paraprevotella sp.]|nr:hypothetical protein [Paraprevotella sp.]
KGGFLCYTLIYTAKIRITFQPDNFKGLFPDHGSVENSLPTNFLLSREQHSTIPSEQQPTL